MKNIYKGIIDLINKNVDCVLVTITNSKGSTPRGAGAKMVVTKEGLYSGTIGGGKVEHEAIEKARRVLEDKKTTTYYYRLNQNDIQDLGMICGGNVDVCFSYIDKDSSYIKGLLKDVVDIYENNEKGYLIISRMEGDEKPLRLSRERADVTEDLYVEKIVTYDRIYIFGGGHVSQALVPVLAEVDFQCIIVEDRKEFTKKELFPEAYKIVLTDFEDIFSTVKIEKNDYVAVMTRGHKDDEKIQAQVLKTSAKYIGVIGSRRKKAIVFSNLKKQGFTERNLDRISTPIGLDIKAETPEEIAISIAAELILKRRG